MVRTHLRHISLPTWFPAGDSVAACMARILILREDLYLEFHGLDPKKLPLLDENNPEWRRIYFSRNIFRTLFEIDGAINQLSKEKDFKEVIKTQSKTFQKEHTQILRNFKRVHNKLKILRNRMGGHVKYEDVCKGLRSLGAGVTGLLVYGSSVENTHYKFTDTLVLSLLGYDMNDDEMKKK